MDVLDGLRMELVWLLVIALEEAPMLWHDGFPCAACSLHVPIGDSFAEVVGVVGQGKDQCQQTLSALHICTP